MKRLLVLILSCLALNCFALNATYLKLCEVNKYWHYQNGPAFYNSNIADKPENENDWVRLHLSLVAQVLQTKPLYHLSSFQTANRIKCLAYLEEYISNGRFPENEHYDSRTPIFIDDYDNFCAVGYLLKVTGHESLSRKVSKTNNVVYVADLADPELDNWAYENGFTKEELAWIQPTYAPRQSASPIGKGVGGEVLELYPDNDEGKLYVGGRFEVVDDTITANSIAYLTENSGVYTWHLLADGVDGTVHAITKYKGKIYAAGEFRCSGSSYIENIAAWNGTNWEDVGCLPGIVKDLAVMGDDLYAAGYFDICGGSKNITFARWDGTMWQPLYGLTGKVNTMEAKDTSLILGGAFIYNNTQVNAIKWSRSSGFKPFNTGILNEVNDFEVFNDTLYAACKRTHNIDSINLIVRLVGNDWLPLEHDNTLNYFRSAGPGVSFKTLCTNGNLLMMGGSYRWIPPVGIPATNLITVRSVPLDMDVYYRVDSDINKLVIFKNEMIAGGSFRSGNNAPVLNGLARSPAFTPLAITSVRKENWFECYPNPTTGNVNITIRNNIWANGYAIRDINGRIIKQGALSIQSTQDINVTGIAPGIYLVEIWNRKGEWMGKQLVIE